jgi:DNA-binding transcriptional ArsR family regulator
MAATQKTSPTQILDTLTARPGVTAAELAAALGMGQSTAAKQLAVLETEGAVRRELGGREAGRRLPDRWSIVAPAGDSAPGEVIQTPDKAANTKGEAPVPADRLGRGALVVMVREYLAARPDEDLGPTQGGKGVGRSQGAVFNALSRLEEAGEVRLVSPSPRRYRIVAGR